MVKGKIQRFAQNECTNVTKYQHEQNRMSAFSFFHKKRNVKIGDNLDFILDLLLNFA